MVATAKCEGQQEAERNFTYACGAEESHAQLFKKALEGLKEMLPVDLYICAVCGYAIEGESFLTFVLSVRPQKNSLRWSISYPVRT